MVKAPTQHWYRHIAAALSSTVVGQLLAGIAQITIVRTLGVAGYGQYAVLYAWLAIAGAIVGAGLDTWLLDTHSRGTPLLRTLLLRLLAYKGGLWLAAFVVCWLWIPGVAHSVLVFGMTALFLDTASTTGFQALRSQNHHPRVAALNLIGPVALLTAVACGAATTVDVLIRTQFVISLILFVAVAVSVWPLLTQSDKAEGRIPRAAWRFVLSDVCAQLYTQSGTLLLGGLLSVTAVGVFRGAWSIVAYSFVFPALVFQTSLPHLNAAQGSDKATVLRRSLFLFLLYGCVMAVGTATLAGPALTLVYGSAYTRSAAVVAALWLIPLCKAISFAAAMILVHAQALRLRIAVQLAVVALLWLTAPGFIRAGGVDGAIQAQILAEAALAIGYAGTAAWVLVLLPAPCRQPRALAIINLHGAGNVGDVAIHRVQHALLARVFPAAHISACYAQPPHSDAPNPTIVASVAGWVYDQHGHIAPLRTRVRKACVVGYALLTGCWQTGWWGLRVAERTTLQTLQHADLVVVSGGGFLYDAPTTQPWRRFVLWDWWLLADVLLALRWGKPVWLFPQSIGPIHSPVYAAVLRRVLRRAGHVAVRDATSAALLESWGIAAHQTVDLAWGLSVPTPTPAPSFTRTLGLTVLDWGAQYPGFTGQIAYEAAVAAVAHAFLTEGWRVIVFVQAIEAAAAWDDRGIAQRIQSRVPSVEIRADISDPVQLAQAYAALDCLVATRLHSAILRLHSGKPCVVIGYLPKARDLCAALGLADVYLPIETVDAVTLRTRIDQSVTQPARFAMIPTLMATAFAAYETSLRRLTHEMNNER